MSISWDAVAELIDRHDRFLLTSHARADCDAAGSELGLACILESLGKEVRIINPDPLPAPIRFLDPGGRIESLATVESPFWNESDLFWVLDTSAWKQLADMADVFRSANCAKAVLDHHRSSDDLGAVTFKDTSAEATGRLVYELARHLQVPLTKAMAVPLLAAITTDTGWLRFNSTSAGTFHAAGDLVAAGAVPHELYENLYEQHSFARLKLQGRALAGSESVLGGLLNHAAVVFDDFTETGAVSTDTEGLVNALLEVKDTIASILFVQMSPTGPWKLSFRSRGEAFDCSKLAENFGGGGHRNASGATMHGSLEEVRAPVLEQARAMLAEIA
jgi:phosphoesterase RecJ-like protein